MHIYNYILYNIYTYAYIWSTHTYICIYMELMDERVEGWLSMEENERVAVAMDKACTDPAVGRAMERLWRKRFT